jgi:iron complex outermembrane receptor protein
MCIHKRRLFLLSSSALMLLCSAGVAPSQTPAPPPETPPATTTPETPPAPTAPETPPAETPAPQPAQPETPGAAPTISVPQVTVEAPKPRPARRAAPAAPAQTTRAPPPAPTPSPTPPTTTTTTTAGQPAATSPFQPPPSLNTITSNQIEASQAQSFGNLFFTMPGATSAGLAPGASRPVLRGLDDFRVRVQENGVGAFDVSDYGQDHGVPIDPLSVQKIEIYRGPEALRFGSQAVGGVVEATNNRIPFAAPPGGWQTQFLGATTTVDRGAEGGALFDAGSRDFAFHADVYGRRGNDYFIPSYPYLFPSDPAPPFNGKQPNSSFHSEGQAVGGSYLFDGGYVGAAVSRFSSLYHIPTMDGAASNNTRIALEQVKYTSKGEFRPQSSAIDVIRYWAGAIEYHHDELGIGDNGLDGIQATFNSHAQETRAEMQFLPMATPLGTLISTVGGAFDHQQIDTSGDAGSLLGSARTNRGAGYLINELWFTDTLRALLAGRVENVRLDGTAGIFPPALVPPPDNPTLSLQSLGFTPASISFKVLQDLPSWMQASATLQRIQRAPSALELFAHGAHDAPGTFDIGDPTLKIETANSAELGLKRWQGDFRFDGKVYYTYYNNFIFRQATGILCGASFATCGVDTEFIQTIFSQRDAIFRGGEIAWQWDLVPVARGVFGVDGQYDFVRATFASDGSNVPRMPPMRLGGGAYWRDDNWFVRMGLLHAFGQRDLGINDTPTAGYNLLKLQIEKKQYWRYSPWGPTDITTGLVGDNLLDVDVRNSVQFHKDEILQPGRSIKFFMNAKFGAEPPTDKAPTGYYKGPTGYGSPIFYKVPVLAAAWSWAGPYLGINVGYSAGKSKTATVFSDASAGTPLFATGSSDNPNGVIAGVQGGYNWMVSSWLVAGIEADIALSTQNTTPTFICPGAICGPTIGAPVVAAFDRWQQLDWFGTVRGRLGATVTPDKIAYVTGGLAVAEIKTAGTVSGFSPVDADGNPNVTSVAVGFYDHKTKAGWSAGAGIETHLSGNLTGKVEYLYLDFGRVGTAASNPLNSTPLAVNFDSRVTDHIVHVGVNYKFDPLVYETPVPAKGLALDKAPTVTAWSWAGPYLGVNYGYGWGKSNTDTVVSDASMGTSLIATSRSGRLDGMTFGGQAGFNWQSGPWVAGIEGDLQQSRQRGRAATLNCPTAICNPAIDAFGLDAPVSVRMAQQLQWFGTLRGRLGVTPTPKSLLYATGGLAVGRIRTSGTITGLSLTLTPSITEGVFDTTVPGVDEDGNPIDIPVEIPIQTATITPGTSPATSSFVSHTTKAGFAVGAGAEVRLAGNWTGKMEYLYLDFGRVSAFAANPLNSTPLAINFDSRITNQIVRAGLNYKFDPTGAAYATTADAKSPMLFKAPVLAGWGWAGPYVGGSIGYSAGKSKPDTIFSDPASGAQLFATRASRNLDGAIGGAQVGYNWLAGIWLAGIEGDLNYSGQRAKLNAVCPGEICNTALIGVIGDPSVIANFEDGQKLEWFATLRGRLGVTVTPDAIAYVTGGLAVGEVMTAGTVFGFDGEGNQVNTIVSSHNTKAGYTLGGGIEGRLTGNWTAKIDYLYLNLGTVTTIPAPAPNATTATAFNSGITDNIVRVGVNYKFDSTEIWPY